MLGTFANNEDPDDNKINTNFLDGNYNLSYDFASGSEITPCNKIDKPLLLCQPRVTVT